MKFLAKNMVLVLLMFFTSGSSTFAATNEVALCDSAKIAYKNQDYKNAIICYEKVVAMGFNSALLHYNLGNAYYKNEQLGHAILHYEISRKLDPSNQDNTTNLGIASSRTIDKINVKENFFATTVKTGLFSFLSTDGWAFLSIALLLFTALIFMLFLVLNSPSLKLFSFWVGVISAIAFIFSMGIGYSALRNLEQKNKAVVITAQANVYGTPSEKEKSKFNLHEGTRAIVLESDGEWTSIVLENGNEGWVKTEEVGLF